MQKLFAVLIGISIVGLTTSSATAGQLVILNEFTMMNIRKNDGIPKRVVMDDYRMSVKISKDFSFPLDGLEIDDSVITFPIREGSKISEDFWYDQQLCPHHNIDLSDNVVVSELYEEAMKLKCTYEFDDMIL